MAWSVDATTNAILELAGYPSAERVEKVTLEATSDYWRIWFYLLESAGWKFQPGARTATRPGNPGTTGRPFVPTGPPPCRGTWECIGGRSPANTPVPELLFSST
jgi:hypothetical protein